MSNTDKKIKILFYSHTIDYGGTWRSHERILLNLDKNKFDPYVFYTPHQKNNRLGFLKTKLDNNNIIEFNSIPERHGPNLGYGYKETNFTEVAKQYNFDIIHFARSGYYEWPFTERIAPIQIETNIFGAKDTSNFLDCSVTICDRINVLRGGSDYQIYNPIPQPLQGKDNLKKELGIQDGYLVFGRIGRPDNFHPIAFKALRMLKEQHYAFKYVILGACEATKNCIQEYDLVDECILIEPTNDDEFIHKLHNTIQVFLHYRIDGECHSTALSQAMMYGIPVISHYAGFNGQAETIKEGGFVAGSPEEYHQYLVKLITNPDFYNLVSKAAIKRAQDFDQNKIVKEWENVYLHYFKKCL